MKEIKKVKKKKEKEVEKINEYPTLETLFHIKTLLTQNTSKVYLNIKANAEIYNKKKCTLVH